ncbi:MAG: hypothetical protein JRD68_14800, partial [Deltaproteobacteria bacterium]|nr:hypothetical protein [Deltaproteobacteria bacterium]
MTLRMMNAGHILIGSKKPDQSNIIMYGLVKPLDFKKQLEALIAETTAGQDSPVT